MSFVLCLDSRLIRLTIFCGLHCWLNIEFMLTLIRRFGKKLCVFVIGESTVQNLVYADGHGHEQWVLKFFIALTLLCPICTQLRTRITLLRYTMRGWGICFRNFHGSVQRWNYSWTRWIVMEESKVNTQLFMEHGGSFRCL